MEIKTYRAKSLQEALRWIRSDLGPEAAVLHTREVRAGWLSWLAGPRLEVTAGLGVHVPSRFPAESLPAADDGQQTDGQPTDGHETVDRPQLEVQLPVGDFRALPISRDALASGSPVGDAKEPWASAQRLICETREMDRAQAVGTAHGAAEDIGQRMDDSQAVKSTEKLRRGETPRDILPDVPRADEQDFRIQYRNELSKSGSESPSLVEELSARPAEESAYGAEWNGAEWNDRDPLLRLFANLTDAEMDDESARELIERLRSRSSAADRTDYIRLRMQLMRLVEDEIDCAGPLQLGGGKRRIVAFVGPTGVGKTTTLAKLAADFHLRQHRRVGLVTIDTYRVAAVDQLRTYADIIDLPMEVVATASEMRNALAKLTHMELVLIDTAGHSPTDERKMQELQRLLDECQADEVQLVVSGVASISSLKQAVARFTALGATRLVVTKLDEMPGLGHLWPVLRRGRLPLSYVTNGQNVPDDFAPAEPRKLARELVKMDGGR